MLVSVCDDEMLPQEVSIRSQVPKPDLGDRMHAAFRQSFLEGFSKV
jgi:hypothetical protein